MGAPELLHHLRGAGLVLTLTPAGGLHVAPRTALNDDHRAAIRAERGAIVLALQAEETAIRAWLALIEETDPAMIAEVIGQCQRDADARCYFIGQSSSLGGRGAQEKSSMGGAWSGFRLTSSL